tara:strand:- start:513 stop:1592 length:1080 start_codon:yes stop_codon:yes gene_type:complete
MAYTNIDDGSEYFHIQTYTGNGSSGHSITNDANSGNFKPDWLWIKPRDSSDNHVVFDSNRTSNKRLKVNSADAEDSDSTAQVTFETDGFDLDTTDGNFNGSSTTYVAWQWKVNGGTTASNSNGTITSTVQANTTAGFSIVTYTGNGSAGATIGHGLGVDPDVVLVKGRSVGDSWTMQHRGIASDFQTDMIKLDEDGAAQDNSVFWNDTAPTSTVFTVDGSGGEPKVNQNSQTYVAYCFTSIKGYSKFGSYKGNGNADGTFVYLGFKPAYVMIKRTNGTDHWYIYDVARAETNGNEVDIAIEASNNNIEFDTSGDLDFLSNGFKNRGSITVTNANTEDYIYWAFAEHPFVSSKGIPVTAR